MMTKTCTRCGLTKETDGFYIHPDRRPRKSGKPGPIGFSAWCRQCYRDKTAAWNRQYKTKARERAWADAKRLRKQQIKDAVFAAYGGYVCACCGETEPKFLSLDHIANNGAQWRKETLGSRLATGWRTYHHLLKQQFPAGYQVLCMNCNFGKRMNGGVCPHQTKRNDYPHEGVGSSEPKRTASLTIQ